MPPEPQIQYAQTVDGVSIAFWSMGEGPPLVCMPNPPFSHVQREWEIPEPRRFLERLGAGHRLVRYDCRGTGLSDREPADFSIEAQSRDLEAVVDRLGLAEFTLFASGDASMAAIACAAAHPERVTHLVLWCTWARRADVSGNTRTQTLRALLDQDWEIYTETVARVILGWHAEEDARRFAAFYRECSSPEVLRAAAPTVYQSDATPFLSQVRCPVLVLHRRGIPSLDESVTRNLAARIPGARLVLLEGASPLPFMGDVGSVLAAVHEFLGDPEETAAAPRPTAGAPVTILFTDIEGSTPLTQRLGDAAAQEILRAHNRIVRGALREHDGNEIKHTGDGIMASFASAARAVECAIGIQRAIERLNAEVAAQHRGGQDLAGERPPGGSPDAAPIAAGAAPLRVRIGLNAGEPVAEDRDLFGTAVQMASRVCERARPGQILASNVVRELVAGKGFLFSDVGEVVLRGFEDPVRLFEARWSEESQT